MPNGLTYVANSAKIAFVADNTSNIQSSAIVDPSAYQTGNETNINNITPNFNFEPSGAPVNSGDDLIFDLGTVTNNDNDPGKEYVVIEFDALVDSAGDNQGSLDNIFSIGSNNSNPVTINVGRDYGDAPDTVSGAATEDYETTQINDGPSHYVTNGLTLGSLVDADSGNLQDPNANADGADEDGIATTLPLLQTGNTDYSLTIDVTNTTGSNATLVGWIDFDRDGTFSSDEAVVANIANNQTQATLTWDSNSTIIPSDIDAGTTYARFRLSSDPTLNTSKSTGLLIDGEVEDYLIPVEAVDYGDAPDASVGTGVGNYQTTEADGGASHIITDGLGIGSTVDADNGRLQNTAANADTDEDGVTFNSILQTGTTSYSVDVEINNDINANLNLVGWIDFDRSGTFDVDEAVTASGTFADGSIQTLTWNSNTIPEDIISGNTYARFRLSSDPTLDATKSTGQAIDGEVEDYQIQIQGVDYGDAPDPTNSNVPGDYTTTSANGGAAHIIDNNLSIGSTVDADNVKKGTSYARFRLSTDTLTPNDSIGTANDGEVEDYQITIIEPGMISGTVFKDTTGDKLGDTPFSGIPISLLNSNGDTIATTTTDSNGNYLFQDLIAGDYTVVETQPFGYTNISEVDGGADGDNTDNGIVNNIPVTLVEGEENDTGNNFVEAENGNITGNVSEVDVNSLVSMNGVELQLLDSSGNPVLDSNNAPITTSTDSNGSYSFNNISPGNYQVTETQPIGYISVSEADGGTDGDNIDNGTINNIPVTLLPGETDSGNNFVEAIPGAITGKVRDTGGNSQEGVNLNLLDSNNNLVLDSNGEILTATTDINGNYNFSNLVPGTYQVIQNPPDGYTIDSEIDGGNDNDNADNGLENNIPVTLDPGETDTGNNFTNAANGTRAHHHQHR